MLRYDDARATSDPRASVLDFYESAYQAGARLAGWDIGRLSCPGGITDPHLRRSQDRSEEAAAAERGTLEEADNAVGLVSAGHPFEVLADANITPEEAQASEEDDDEPAPEPILGIHIEPDDRTR